MACAWPRRCPRAMLFIVSWEMMEPMAEATAMFIVQVHEMRSILGRNLAALHSSVQPQLL